MRGLQGRDISPVRSVIWMLQVMKDKKTIKGNIIQSEIRTKKEHEGKEGRTRSTKGDRK
jgi:hypothetical protein